MKFIETLDIYIKIQNIQLIKLICYQENWDYIEMIDILRNIYNN
jgi:hypothetical protein